MTLRCNHIDVQGRQCSFYVEGTNQTRFCALHKTPMLLQGLIHLLRLPKGLNRPRTLTHDTELFLTPHERLSRGVLHSGETVRVLAADRDDWLQVEVVHASRVPVQARGWVRRCAIRPAAKAKR